MDYNSLKKLDKDILKELYSKEELLIYTLYTRLNTTPGKIAESILFLSDYELIIITSTSAKLSTKGYDLLNTTPSVENNEKNESTYSSAGNKIEINSFYIPKSFKK